MYFSNDLLIESCALSTMNMLDEAMWQMKMFSSYEKCMTLLGQLHLRRW